ncbi:MAG: sulfite exporter TauE/SafE family protein [Acidobacteriaceae bacterium]
MEVLNFGGDGPVRILVLVLVGVASGLVNTLASSGSAISLPVLMFLGLPPGNANATNRLACMLGSMMALRTFHSDHMIDWKAGRRMLAPAVLGSVIGVLAAERLPGRDMGLVITAALMVALLLIFTKIKAVLARPHTQPSHVTFAGLVVLFGVGIWLGFIALDGNTYLLLVLMVLFHFDLPQANALKILLMFATTVLPVAIFAWSGSIWWKDGLVLSAGSLAGSFAGARLSRYAGARRWVFRLLVAAISLEVVHLGAAYYGDVRAHFTITSQTHPYTQSGRDRQH